MSIEDVEPASRARGPYRRGVARQGEIIAAATKIFANDGYRGGSLRDVARALDVSPGAVLHHFGSKEQLLVAVLEDRDEHTGVDAGVFESQPIVTSLRAIVRDNQARPGLVRLYTTLSAEAVTPDHPAHVYFAQRYERLRAFIINGLDRDGFESPIGLSNEALANLVLATMDGLQIQWLLDPRFSMIDGFDALLRGQGLLTA